VSTKDGFLTTGYIIVSLFAEGNHPEKQKTYSRKRGCGLAAVAAHKKSTKAK